LVPETPINKKKIKGNKIQIGADCKKNDKVIFAMHSSEILILSN